MYTIGRAGSRTSFCNYYIYRTIHLSRNDQIETAISVFSENVKRHPGSANVYDSLGEAYENNIQYELAEKNYQKAYDLGMKSDDLNTAIYKKNLERVRGK